MSNRNLFKSQAKAAPVPDTVNRAGGKAYSFEKKHCLAQIAATNCFNGTYYASAEDNLKLAKDAAQALRSDPLFIAKVAVYSRERAYMKDMPAFLTAMLLEIDKGLFRKVFRKVINNGKMLRNFVQIARSGAAGRVANLSASATRKAVQEWFDSKSPASIFRATVGNDPKLSDVLKMCRPRPNTEEKNALFGYILNKPQEFGRLPAIVQQYEKYKSTRKGEVPNVDFRLLDSLGLSKAEWSAIARNAAWTMTRMNLNTFVRHGVFEDKELVKVVADRLRNAEEIRKAAAFPYQLMMAYKATDGNIPHEIREALQDAMEIAVDNTPMINGDVYIGVDVSGSMSCAVTGNSHGRHVSAVRCLDVAALYAASILRRNRSAQLLPFDDRIHTCNLNPRDTVLTNANHLARYGGGGTNCSLVLNRLNETNVKASVVIYISDNESWMDSNSPSYYRIRGTGMMEEWLKFKKRNPQAKLICMDLTPRNNSQIQQRPDVLQVGGFSDTCFDVIASFVEHGSDADHWVKVIDEVSLD